MGSTTKFKLFITLFIAATAGVIFLLAPLLTHHLPPAVEETAKRTTQTYQLLAGELTNSLHELTELDSDSAIHRFFLKQEKTQPSFCYFLFTNDTLSHWSDNKIDLADYTTKNIPSETFLLLKNGWYVLFKKQHRQHTAIGLLLIKNNYAYQNSYLYNAFNPVFQLPENTQLVDISTEESFAVKSDSGRDIFKVKLNDQPTHLNSSLGWFQACALLLLLIALFRFQRTYLSGTILKELLFVTLLIVLRYIMIRYDVPAALYESVFFSPQLYASSFWFNSPGDFLINAILIFILTQRFYRYCTTASFALKKWQYYLSLYSVVATAIPLHSLISGIIINSRIPFDAENLFELNIYTVAAVFITALILFSYFFLVRSIVLLSRENISPGEFFLSALVATIFTSLYLVAEGEGIGSGNFSWIDILFIACLFAVNGIYRKQTISSGNFLLLNILFFSLYAAAIIHTCNQRKEQESRKMLATKLESNRDKIAEYLYCDVAQKITSDTILIGIIRESPDVQENLSRRINRFYLDGYWNQYDVTVTCLKSTGESYDSLSGWTLNSALKFIENYGDSTECHQLFSVSYESGRLAYISLLPVQNTDSILSYVLLRFDEKPIQVNEGLPELFISGKASLGNISTAYSMARYKDSTLIFRTGDYTYMYSANSLSPLPEKNNAVFIDAEEYNHLISCLDDGYFLVISRKGNSPFIFFTLFSYLIVFFSFILLIYFGLLRLNRHTSPAALNFKQRIQISILALVIFSFLLIGGETIYYIVNRYNQSQEEQIKTRVNSLSQLLDNVLDKTQDEIVLSDDSRYALSQLATIFNSDFNLFSADGKLLFSSKSKIYEQGIIADVIDPDALYEIQQNGRTSFVHPENIGKLNFIAAYEPLRNTKGQLIAYLNIPYFEKQSELNKEISSFLSSLINIYVLLFALAIFATLVISSRITIPLKLIQEKLGNIRLGKRNEHINWNKQDEIGELVQEYNRMVDELAISAEKLTTSEREGAWREMAKQVAHEIKNPLTPMKLSIQHLQRAWEEKDPRAVEIQQRIAQTLISQIDSLANIATAFADFAKMPERKTETVNLNELVKQTVDLFKSANEAAIQLKIPVETYFVRADKDQLSRVLSNLLKNALQAIPETKSGNIEVVLLVQNDHFLIEVSDNGTGIPKELIPNIFTPNFTTKNSGMGLGLAISKSIIENSGGKIGFRTQEDSGSTFYILLPKYHS